MDFKELHNILFDILCCFDDICTKNNIPYSISGGTLLGTVRSGDFIPWDDDIDVLVFMDDVQRIKTIMEKELPAYLLIKYPSDSFPSYLDLTIRIFDNRFYLNEDQIKGDERDFLNHPSFRYFGFRESTFVKE